MIEIKEVEKEDGTKDVTIYVPSIEINSEIDKYSDEQKKDK